MWRQIRPLTAPSCFCYLSFKSYCAAAACGSFHLMAPNLYAVLLLLLLLCTGGRSTRRRPTAKAIKEALIFNAASHCASREKERKKKHDYFHHFLLKQTGFWHKSSVLDSSLINDAHSSRIIYALSIFMTKYDIHLYRVLCMLFTHCDRNSSFGWDFAQIRRF